MRSNNRNRRWAGSIGMAVGAAFAAALIGLVNAPAARADSEVLPSDDLSGGLNPFEDLFGNSGINTWTTSADSSLASSDPTLAANMDTSVDNFLLNIGYDDPLSALAYQFDPSAFSDSPDAFGYYLSGSVPTDLTGDLALGLDYTLFVSNLTGVGSGLTDIVTIPEDIVIALLYLPLLPFILAGA